MTVFAGYSRYYDLLYRDKNYGAEARYVADLIHKHAPSARELMEIGCGTGAHAAEWAGMGFSVAGVDRSEGMLEAAAARRSSLDPQTAARISFREGDARTVRLGKKFDAVTSLFHVMSYQTGNSDIAAAFRTVREHLKPGGVFVFDCWYGPAVLRQWPSVTKKNLADESISVVRTAVPVVHPGDNTVEVNYTVVVTDVATGEAETLCETHRMRYLFTPEIELALATAGMTLVDSRAWMTDGPPDFESWSACYAARA